MPTTIPTILDQISAEKTKISERLARLDTDRAKIATELTDLETAERVLTRVSKAPPGRKPRAASVVEVKGPLLREADEDSRQKQPRASQRDANPAHQVSASAYWAWLPARPDRNFTRRAQTIARTT
jgi:hypothetical protein